MSPRAPSLSRHLLLALTGAFLVALVLSCSISNRTHAGSTDRGLLILTVENATIHDVLLKQDRRTIAHIRGGQTVCLHVIAHQVVVLTAYAMSGTGFSQNRITRSPPINPNHTRYWDWRITSFAAPETGPLVESVRACAYRLT